MLLDLEKTFAEQDIRDNAKLVLVGVPGAQSASDGKIKQFRRFKETRANDSWYVGRERWDAIVFAPKSDVKIYGIGVYEKYDAASNFTIGYQYFIESGDSQTITQSPVYEEEVIHDPTEIVDHVIWHKFQN